MLHSRSRQIISRPFMSLPYAAEKQVALAAVRRACSLTDSVFNKLVRTETFTKEDTSPVTGILNHLFNYQVSCELTAASGRLRGTSSDQHNLA